MGIAKKLRLSFLVMALLTVVVGMFGVVGMLVKINDGSNRLFITIQILLVIITIIYIVVAVPRILKIATKQYIEEMNRAERSAEQSNRAKSDFLSRISHESRTPINVILNMIKFIRTSPERFDKEQCAQHIETAARHLLNIFDNVLNFSMLDEGTFKFNHSLFSFKTMIQQSLEVINFYANENNISLSVYIDDSIPTRIISDEVRLIQVIVNLMTNAIKFSSENGSIKLSAVLVNERLGRQTIKIEVADNGIGISGEQLAGIFAPLEQVDGGTVRSYGGLGLGLSISKRIIEMMGGEMHVTSTLGQGTTFSFTFRTEGRDGKQFADEDTSDLPEKMKDAFTGKKMLLAEDIEINYEIVLTLLEETGIKIDWVENGLLAVCALKAEPEFYDIVLMDINMPIVDGIEATRMVRASETPAADIPIIALTANILPEEINRYMEAGMNGHVGKPIDYNELVLTIDRFLDYRANPREDNS